jgi:hypothetical protein
MKVRIGRHYNPNPGRFGFAARQADEAQNRGARRRNARRL